MSVLEWLSLIYAFIIVGLMLAARIEKRRDEDAKEARAYADRAQRLAGRLETAGATLSRRRLDAPSPGVIRTTALHTTTH